MKSDELGYWLETDEEKYNAVFQEATFKTYSFRMRVKEDHYNEESRLKKHGKEKTYVLSYS